MTNSILTVCKLLCPVFDLCPLIRLAVNGLEGMGVGGDGLRGGAEFSARWLSGWSWYRSYRQGGVSHQMGLGEAYLGKNGTQQDLEANVDLQSVCWKRTGIVNDCLSHKSLDVDMELSLVIILPLKGSKFGLDVTNTSTVKLQEMRHSFRGVFGSVSILRQALWCTENIKSYTYHLYSVISSVQSEVARSPPFWCHTRSFRVRMTEKSLSIFQTEVI